MVESASATRESLVPVCNRPCLPLSLVSAVDG